MLMKPCLFLCLLTVLQVSARYKNVDPDFINNELKSETAAVSSLSPRIVSGWEAQPGQHPHHAALRFVNVAGNLFLCGGSIVSREWVMTRALCTHNRVRVGILVGGGSLSNPKYIFESTRWHNYPNINHPGTIVEPNGIALVKLPQPLVYSSLVKAIRVQSSADALRNYDGEQVYASGHDRTQTGLSSDVLRWVYLRAMSNAACGRIYFHMFDTIICAQYFNVISQSSCTVDFGGPLVHVGSDGIPTLIGVNYFHASNYGCQVGGTLTGPPPAFVRPGFYHQWFTEVTGIDFENLQEVDETTTAIITTTDSTTSTATTTTDSTTSTATTTTDSTTSTATTTTDSTTSIATETTDSGEQGPDENTTGPPEDSDENDEESESSEHDMAQLLKRLEVNVKVKVALSKYNVTNVENEMIA